MEPGSANEVRVRNVYVALAIVLTSWLVLGWRTDHRGIWSAHEGRAAQNAQSMLDTGDWLMPTLFTGDFDCQKPPLYYWLVAAVSRLLGDRVCAWSVRAPALFAGFIGLAVVYRFASRQWNRTAGLFAVIVLLTTTRYAWLARVGRIDLPLTVVTAAALLGFWNCLERAHNEPAGNHRVATWCYAMIGLGILLKGPVAAVMVLLPVAVYQWLIRRPVFPVLQGGWQETWRTCRVVPGVFIAAAISLPWFVYAIWISRGQFFWEFFLHHNLERALGSAESLEAGPIWFYIPRLLVDCFPWSLLLPAVVASLWHHRARACEVDNPRVRAYLFLLAWIGGQFVFLSVVSFKRAEYLLPIYPALAVLIAGWLTDRVVRFERRLANRPARNPRRRSRAIVLSASGLAALAAPTMIWAIVEFCKKGVIRTLFDIEFVRRHFNETDRFMLDRVEELLRANWPILVIATAVIVCCVWSFHVGWHQRRNWQVIGGLACPWLVGFLIDVHVLMPAIDPVREMATFAEIIRTVASKDRTVFFFGKFDADLIFHVGRPTRIIGDWESVLRLAESPAPCFVVMKASEWERAQKERRSDRLIVVADNRETAFGVHRDPRVLVTNQPLLLAGRPGDRG
jgi:4-amino-4-deoxy-L-arabinose transferase-like glycosyltransferase